MKKRLWSSFILLLLISGCSNENTPVMDKEHDVHSAITTEESSVSNKTPATVVSVTDGDTFTADVNGTKEKIRLLLVDTPETVHPTKPVQPFGPEASDFTKSVLTVGKKVELEFDVGQRDKYGRLLAYVYVDGKMLNEMLLEKGLARFVVYPPNTKYVDEFGALQENAQNDAVGIWSIENYASEDRAKKDLVSQDCENPNIKGNINSKGEKIYHIPGGQYYDATVPEQLFCSEDYAKEAGYRKSKR